ncbi:hypothetical protein JZ751_006599, partial [Albula glossodonta]
FFSLFSGPELTFFSVLGTRDSLRFQPFHPCLVTFYLRIHYQQVVFNHFKQKNQEFMGVRFFSLFSGPELTFFSVSRTRDSLRFLPFNPCLVSSYLHIHYQQVVFNHFKQKNQEFMGVRFFSLFSGPELTFFSVSRTRDSLRFLPFNPCLVSFYLRIHYQQVVFNHFKQINQEFMGVRFFSLFSGPELTFFSVSRTRDSLRFLPFNPCLVSFYLRIHYQQVVFNHFKQKNQEFMGVRFFSLFSGPELTFFSVSRTRDSLRFLPFNPCLVSFYLRIHYQQVVFNHFKQKNQEFMGVRFFSLFSGPELTFFSVSRTRDSLRFLPFNPCLVSFYLRIHYQQVVFNHFKQKNQEFMGVLFFSLFSGPELTFFSVSGTRDSLHFQPFHPCLVTFYLRIHYQQVVFNHFKQKNQEFMGVRFFSLFSGPELTFFSVSRTRDSLRFLPFNPCLVTFYLRIHYQQVVFNHFKQKNQEFMGVRFFSLFSGPELTFFSVSGTRDSLRFLPFHPCLVTFYLRIHYQQVVFNHFKQKNQEFMGVRFFSLFSGPELTFFSVSGTRDSLQFQPFHPCLVTFYLRIHYQQVVFNHFKQKNQEFMGVRFFSLFSGPELTFFSVSRTRDSLRFLPFNPCLVSFYLRIHYQQVVFNHFKQKNQEFMGVRFFSLFSGPELTFFSVSGTRDSLLFLPFNPCLVTFYLRIPYQQVVFNHFKQKNQEFMGVVFNHFKQKNQEFMGVRFFSLFSGPELTFFSVSRTRDSLRFQPFHPCLVTFYLRIYYQQVVFNHFKQKNQEFMGVRFFSLFSGPELTFFSVSRTRDSLRFLPFNPCLVTFYLRIHYQQVVFNHFKQKNQEFMGVRFFSLFSGPELTFFSVRSLRFFRFRAQGIPCVFCPLIHVWCLLTFVSTISRLYSIILSRKIKNLWGSDFSHFFQVVFNHFKQKNQEFMGVRFFSLFSGPELTFFSVSGTRDSLRFQPFHPCLVTFYLRIHYQQVVFNHFKQKNQEFMGVRFFSLFSGPELTFFSVSRTRDSLRFLPFNPCLVSFYLRIHYQQVVFNHFKQKNQEFMGVRFFSLFSGPELTFFSVSRTRDSLRFLPFNPCLVSFYLRIHYQQVVFNHFKQKNQEFMGVRFFSLFSGPELTFFSVSGTRDSLLFLPFNPCLVTFYLRIPYQQVVFNHFKQKNQEFMGVRFFSLFSGPELTFFSVSRTRDSLRFLPFNPCLVSFYLRIHYQQVVFNHFKQKNQEFMGVRFFSLFSGPELTFFSVSRTRDSLRFLPFNPCLVSFYLRIHYQQVVFNHFKQKNQEFMGVRFFSLFSGPELTFFSVSRTRDSLRFLPFHPCLVTFYLRIHYQQVVFNHFKQKNQEFMGVRFFSLFSGPELTFFSVSGTRDSLQFQPFHPCLVTFYLRIHYQQVVFNHFKQKNQEFMGVRFFSLFSGPELTFFSVSGTRDSLQFQPFHPCLVTFYLRIHYQQVVFNHFKQKNQEFMGVRFFSLFSGPELTFFSVSRTRDSLRFLPFNPCLVSFYLRIHYQQVVFNHFKQKNQEFMGVRFFSLFSGPELTFFSVSRTRDSLRFLPFNPCLVSFYLRIHYQQVVFNHFKQKNQEFMGVRFFSLFSGPELTFFSVSRTRDSLRFLPFNPCLVSFYLRIHYQQVVFNHFKQKNQEFMGVRFFSLFSGPELTFFSVSRTRDSLRFLPFNPCLVSFYLRIHYQQVVFNHFKQKNQEFMGVRFFSLFSGPELTFFSVSRTRDSLRFLPFNPCLVSFYLRIHYQQVVFNHFKQKNQEFMGVRFFSLFSGPELTFFSVSRTRDSLRFLPFNPCLVSFYLRIHYQQVVFNHFKQKNQEFMGVRFFSLFSGPELTFFSVSRTRDSLRFLPFNPCLVSFYLRIHYQQVVFNHFKQINQEFMGVRFFSLFSGPELTFFSVSRTRDSLRFLPFNPCLVSFYLRIHYQQVVFNHFKQKNQEFMGVRFFSLFSGPELTFFSVSGTRDSLRFLPFNPCLVSSYLRIHYQQVVFNHFKQKNQEFMGLTFFSVSGTRDSLRFLPFNPCLVSFYLRIHYQ